MTSAVLEPTGLIEPEDAEQNEIISLRDALRALAEEFRTNLPREQESGRGARTAHLTPPGWSAGSSNDRAVELLRALVALSETVHHHDLRATNVRTAPLAGEGARLLLEVRTGRGRAECIALPGAWSGALLLEVAQLLTGQSVEWGIARDRPATLPDELGTGQLAALLGLSRPTVQAALDRGDVPVKETPGGHRRVLRADALAWKARMEKQRTSVRDLMQMAQRDETEGASLPRGVVRSRNKRQGDARRGA